MVDLQEFLVERGRDICRTDGHVYGACNIGSLMVAVRAHERPAAKPTLYARFCWEMRGSFFSFPQLSCRCPKSRSSQAKFPVGVPFVRRRRSRVRVDPI